MTSDYAALRGRIQAWFAKAADAHWIAEQQTARLAALESATPAELFAADGPRPLVVALFGGTGVGKSSLLNRLAQAPLARTGVERPTSHEVTLYLYDTVQLERLPDGAPTEQVQLMRHSRSEWQDVLWVDAPDIDSVEQANRALALAWLPYVDLLIYVVNPERYRDDAGWRVLLERRGRHGWMFVINHWDAGAAQQRDDFSRLLTAAGFESPAVFCTSCAPERATLPSADEFAGLQDAVRELVDAHGVAELERLGHVARLREHEHALRTAATALGDERAWEEFKARGTVKWRETEDKLREGLDYAARVAAARFAVREGTSVWRSVGRAAMGLRPKPETPDTQHPTTVDGMPTDLDFLRQFTWDAWADGKLAAWRADVEVAASRSGIAVEPLRARLGRAVEAAATLTSDAAQDAVRAALARPGRLWQRIARRITGFMMAFLPIAALTWVGYAALEGFYRASRGEADYLGTAFGVNAALLVLAAWALPYFLDRQLRPSVERTVLEALRNGISSGLTAIQLRLEAAISDAENERDELQRDVDEIAAAVRGLSAKSAQSTASAPVRRVLADDSLRVDKASVAQRGS